MSTTCTGPQRWAARTWTGLRAPNVTVAVAVTNAPSTAPVSVSTPLGRSTARIGTPARSTAATSGGAGSRSPPRPEIPTMPSSTRSAAVSAASPAASGPTTCPARPPERGQPGRVRARRIEQHRDHARAPAAQLDTGPERVAAVVARADEQPDPPSRGAPQHAAGVPGEPERGPSHQGAFGELRHEALLGFPDLFRGEDAVHAA